MHRSTQRILTSHVGSLPRPAALLEQYRTDARPDALESTLSAAVADVVARQLEAGIDIVNDGEYGKPATSEIDYGAFQGYVYERLEGYELRWGHWSDLDAANRDFVDFADYYASAEATTGENLDAPVQIAANVGPIRYVGHAAVRRDIANLQAALPAGGTAFLSAMAPGAEHFQHPSEHYASADEESRAFAEALREELAEITGAGLVAQLDDPWLVDRFATGHSLADDRDGFRRWAAGHVEVVNHALRDIPPELVRLHVCWGSWKGPHSSDLPLKDVIDLLLALDVGCYSVEAANPMHEHEWRVWADVDVPEDKVVMPGVVSHKTNVLEHPEVVADRLVNYANAVGREQVIAGTDCGMGGRIHPQIAWAKLRALADGAELASRRLWNPRRTPA